MNYVIIESKFRALWRRNINFFLPSSSRLSALASLSYDATKLNHVSTSQSLSHVTILIFGVMVGCGTIGVDALSLLADAAGLL